jgi:hypothetical protein
MYEAMRVTMFAARVILVFAVRVVMRGRMHLGDGARLSHQPEMAMGSGMWMAVQAPAVAVNVRIDGRPDHQFKLAQRSAEPRPPTA